MYSSIFPLRTNSKNVPWMSFKDDSESEVWAWTFAGTVNHRSANQVKHNWIPVLTLNVMPPNMASKMFFFCFNLIPDRSNIILMTLWGKEEYRRKGQEVGDQFDGWSQENTEPWFTYFLIYKMSHAFPTHFSRDFAIKWSDWCQYALKKYFFCFPNLNCSHFC